MAPTITPFFDPETFSYSYVIASGQYAAIIDAVLDYDPVSGKASTANADKITAFVKGNNLQTQWIVETHVHADHLSAAQHLKQQLGGQIAISASVTEVQKIFGGVFNAGEQFATDGSQFDRLLNDGDELALGDDVLRVMATPGHTPGCVTYLIGENAFVGDTLFMPDYGTARTDFPGGNASQLFDSIGKILALPPQTTLYMCHDYGTEGRPEFECITCVAAQRASNIHVNESVSQSEFVEFRTYRDKDLAAPRLLYPAVQFNMRAGNLPPAEQNGQHYFKIPARLA